MNFFQTLGGTPTGGRGFGGGRGGGVGTPTPAFTREEVRAIFYPSRVVTLMMPYQTPRAANIRAFCAARLLNENNQRLFIFRSNVPQNMFWTNVALASTPANPVLTADLRRSPASSRRSWPAAQTCPASSCRTRTTRC